MQRGGHGLHCNCFPVVPHICPALMPGWLLSCGHKVIVFSDPVTSARPWQETRAQCPGPERCPLVLVPDSPRMAAREDACPTAAAQWCLPSLTSLWHCVPPPLPEQAHPAEGAPLGLVFRGGVWRTAERGGEWWRRENDFLTIRKDASLRILPFLLTPQQEREAELSQTGSNYHLK